MHKKTTGYISISIQSRVLALALLWGVMSPLSGIQDTLIIPSERRTAWNPGIPGGIPPIAGPVENILDHGADPTGKADSRSALIYALFALPPSGGVVYIPEGKYRVGGKITIGRDNVVFRGEGRKSKLLFESDGDCIEVVTYQRGNWQALPEAASKDSVTVTVGSGAVFTPGGFAEIEQDNDSLLMYTSPDWIVSWAENSVGQLFEVVAVEGNRVTFATPVNTGFSTGLNARIRPLGLVRHVGFEDLYVEKMIPNGSTIVLKNTAYCWIRNVESYHTRRSHVNMSSCLGNEVRESYFHHSFSYGGGGSGYGVECQLHATGNLVENNIFDSLRHAMIIQLGANGNVYGYNYSAHPVQGEGETSLNNGWIPPDVSIHGHYPFMNLFEGNEVDEIGIGDWWGPAGPGNTYFRNRVNDEGIIYYDRSHLQNLVGNITTVLKDQDGQSQQKLEHGNVVGGTVTWDPGMDSTALPPSLYLDALPAFLEGGPWPLFGPDADPWEGLPARTRYENLPYLYVSPDKNPVGRYEKLEFTIDNGKTYENPFDPDEADISGEFISPSSDTLNINGFWDGTAWKLRFAGAETGVWNYTVRVKDADGTEENSGTFSVVGSERKGWLRVSPEDPHYLAHDDGTSFFGVGMAVPWLVYDSRYYEQPGLFARLASHGVNFINWLFTSWDILPARDSFQVYSMEDAEAFDMLLEDAEASGIRIMLGIWIHDLLRDAPHPWSGFYDWGSNPFNQLTDVEGFFSDPASWAYQEKYYRYIIARWGYSTSIAMWHTVAEINGTNAIYDPLAMTNDEAGWHNRINRFFQENDPFGHPTTVSGSGGYDFSAGWEITGCPQVHEYPWPQDNIIGNADRIAYWSDRLSRAYQKPVLVGEFGKYLYEEGKSESFLHNGIWAGLMSGSSVTPLHWWGGQIAVQPENFSVFNPVMMEQLLYLKQFAGEFDLAAHGFRPIYGDPPGEQPMLTGMPEGRIYGLRGDSLFLCWIYGFSETSTGQFTDVGMTVPGLQEGTWSVAFFDPWTGTWHDDTIRVDAEGVDLAFTCPGFTGDIALRISYEGPVDHTAVIPHPGKGDPGDLACRIFPNPCTSVLQVEPAGPVRSVRLLDITGRELEQRVGFTESRIQFDLSAYTEGIYLLEVRDQEGGARTFRVVRNL